MRVSSQFTRTSPWTGFFALNSGDHPMHFNPRNRHSLWLIICGKAAWILFYSIAVSLVICVLLNMIGLENIAKDLLVWGFSHIMQFVNFLLCATALGALWESIAPR
jgi:hypothetical protein